MDKKTLVSITVSRDNEEIVYKVDCSSEVLSDELEYYLKEIINGICTWKPNVCVEKLQSYRGKIKKRAK